MMKKKKGKIKKISLEGVINKSKSSCYIFHKDYNTEKKIFSKENKEKNESQNESELTGLFDNIEEKKMVERLYKAYKKFGKNKEENNKDIIKNDKNSIVKNLFLSYE